MSTDMSALHPRRAVIAGALAGLAALIAQGFGRPAGARAADGDSLVLGQTNNADNLTHLWSQGGGLSVQSEAAYTAAVTVTGRGPGVSARGDTHYSVGGFSPPGGTGVMGFTWVTSGPEPGAPPPRPYTGVQGFASGSTDAAGVWGESTTGTGVVGKCSAEGVGVRGQSPEGTGVHGLSDDGPGVYGQSGTGPGVAAYSRWGNGVKSVADGPDGYGVEAAGVAGGVLASSGPGNGILARSDSGIGVEGTSQSGTGVVGNGAAFGVQGLSSSGTGVLAESLTGTALNALGSVRFSTATLATIPAGSNRVTVSPGIDLTAVSKVLCTLNSDPAGKSVRHVSVDPVADTYTVFLSGRATIPITVACFVIS